MHEDRSEKILVDGNILTLCLSLSFAFPSSSATCCCLHSLKPLSHFERFIPWASSPLLFSSRHPAASYSIPQAERSHRTCKPPPGFCCAHPVDAKQGGKRAKNPGYHFHPISARVVKRYTAVSPYPVCDKDRILPCCLTSPAPDQAKLRHHDVSAFFLQVQYPRRGETPYHGSPDRTSARRPVSV